MPTDGIRDRLKAVRLATKLRQEDFATALDNAARALMAREAPRYTQTRVSDIERGARAITLDDIAVYAQVDPEARGKLWLGWNESVDSALRGRSHGPSVIKEPPEEIFDQPIAPAKKPSRKRA